MREKTNLKWKLTALKLQEALTHHISEEESEIFDEAVKSVMDMVINMLPPRLADRIRGIDNTKH